MFIKQVFIFGGAQPVLMGTIFLDTDSGLHWAEDTTGEVVLFDCSFSLAESFLLRPANRLQNP